MAAHNHKDTYLATSVTLIITGVLYLLDYWINLASFGYGWLVSKDNLLLIAALMFLIIKNDKSIGIILLAVWIILNTGLIVSTLGQLPSYLFPLALIFIGLLMFYLYRR